MGDFYDKRRPVFDAATGLVTLVNDNPLARNHKKPDEATSASHKSSHYQSAEQKNFARFYEFEPRLSKDPLGRRLMGEFDGKCFSCNADVDTFAKALAHLVKLLKYFGYDLKVGNLFDGPFFNRINLRLKGYPHT